MPSHPCLRAGALALGAALLLAAPAHAAPAVANATARPADTAAGAHADFSVGFDVTGLGAAAGGDDLKSLRLDLPPGLVGNPLATGALCAKAAFAADACPAGTKVGTTTTVASVGALLADVPQTIAGDIYNIATSGKEAARLGIVLRPAGGLLPKVFLESPASVRASDGGLTSVVDDIPRTASGLDLRIDRMTLTLLGQLPSGKAFMTNPTSCAPAPTAITIGTYAGATASAGASFTPNACDALPFAPQLSARIGASRADLRPGAQPEVTVTVTQEPGEANAKSVAVALPPGFGAAVSALANACPVETYLGGTCPATSVVGSASATTPLLATPLTGPVTFVSDPSLGLPRLRVALHGAFDVNLTGVVTIGPDGGLVNTFDGIYDVPLSRFVLTIAAGSTSPVSVGHDLCLDDQAGLRGTFVAHSGRTATASAVAERVGCATIAATRVTARLGRLKPGRPALRVSAANADRAIKRLAFRLPRGLTFAPRAKRSVKVVAPGGGVHPTVVLRRGRLTVSLSGDGSPRVDVLVASRAIRVSRALRRARHPKPRLRLDVGLAGGATQHRTAAVRLVRAP